MAYTSKAEIQTALYGFLAPSGVVDATLTSLGIVGVYDWMNIPQNAAFDYITIGDSYETPKNTLGTSGHDKGWLCYPTVHIWSSQKNSANPDAMEDRINSLLIDEARQPWTLTTLTHVYTMLNRSMNQYDTSGTFPILHKTLQYVIYSVQS